MVETTYYQRNRETVLNREKCYQENNKEVLRKKAKNKYRQLSEEEKNIKGSVEEIGIKIFLKKRNKD